MAGFGMGCYRVGNAHRGALEHALSGAVNVIDTASIYLAGESERVIGQVLAGPLQARRQELVVVTKVGCLQGPVLQEVERRQRRFADHENPSMLLTSCINSVVKSKSSRQRMPCRKRDQLRRRAATACY